jgi:hypothetical protein
MTTTPTRTTITASNASSSDHTRGLPLAVETFEGSRSSATRTQAESYGLPPRLPLAQRSVMAERVAFLETLLFDGDCHLRRGLDDERAARLLSQINNVRHDLGWLTIDRHHHPEWPEHIAS